MEQKAQSLPPDFIGKARAQLHAQIETLFEGFLYSEQPQPPSGNSVWTKSVQRDIQQLGRSSQARRLYLPEWNQEYFQLLDETLTKDAKIRLFNNILKQEHSKKLQQRLIIDDSQAASLSESQLDQHFASLLLSMMKPSFQEGLGLAPKLRHKLWMYANFLMTIGKHLSGSSNQHCYALCVLLACQFSGSLMSLRFLHRCLNRRSDQEATINWLCYDSIRQHSKEFSLQICRDWELPSNITDALEIKVNRGSTYRPLIEQYEIAAKTCLLYNQGLIDQSQGQDLFRQWQIPRRLLSSFAPSNPRQSSL